MAYCERCDRYFRNKGALIQHENDSGNHHLCNECDLDFESAWALEQHYIQSPIHPYCRACEELFDDFEDLYDHYEDEHYYCDECNRIFKNEIGLHEHRRQKHADVYCVPCKRMFKDNVALRNHQRSAYHQGRTISCPMKGCGKSFVSPAALVLHLESGGCASRMTREMVDRIVSELDKGGLITNPSRLIEGGSFAGVTRMWATNRAWNGLHYECYLCHRTFASLDRLNQHLDSPRHGDKLYHCPTGLRGCGAEFRTLSGFRQHVESEQCGVHRFQHALNSGYIDAIPKGRLLK